MPNGFGKEYDLKMDQWPVELTLVGDVAVLLAFVSTGVDAEDDGIRVSLGMDQTRKS